MEQKTIGLIIAVAIASLMGVILVQVLAEQIVGKTTRTAVLSETIDLTLARLTASEINTTYYFHLNKGCPNVGWRHDIGSGCYLQDLGIKSGNNTLLVTTTDYILNTNNGDCSTGITAGDFRMANSSVTVNMPTNTTRVSYSYCPDDYVSGWGSTITNLVPGFFALAILVGVAFIIFFVLRQEGITTD